MSQKGELPVKKSRSWKSAWKAMALAAVCGTAISFAAVPVPQADANILGAVIGAVQGGAAYAQIDKQLNYYNNTEEGRQKLYTQYKEKYGVNYDSFLNAQLDAMMNEMSAGIRAVDPTIDKKPYIYFINNDTSFNAFCTLGHNLSVNIGAFEKLAYDEDELAFVIGHELAHGEKKHPARGVTRGLPVSLLAALYSSQNPNAASYIGATLLNAVGTAKLVTKPMETEADKLGFDYAVGAGYNIGGGAALWQRILERNGKGHGGFAELFNDHPRSISRRDAYSKRLTKWSNNKVRVNADTGEILVQGKSFYTPKDNGVKSGLEQAYLIAGNLAAVFHDPDQAPGAVTTQGGVLLVGRQPILTLAGTPDPAGVTSRLAAILNPKQVASGSRKDATSH